MIRLVLLALFLLPGTVWADGYELGFKNSDGTQDSYNTDTGSWEIQTRNPDGSVDKYNTGEGSYGMGSQNSDGSQDTYWIGTEDDQGDDWGY